MAIVTVKDKYQVVIPSDVREKIALSIGDILKASVRGNTITLTPQTLIDREIAEGLDDIRKGHVSPSYHSAHDLIQALHRETRQRKSKRQC